MLFFEAMPSATAVPTGKHKVPLLLHVAGPAPLDVLNIFTL